MKVFCMFVFLKSVQVQMATRPVLARLCVSRRKKGVLWRQLSPACSSEQPQAQYQQTLLLSIVPDLPYSMCGSFIFFLQLLFVMSQQVMPEQL